MSATMQFRCRHEQPYDERVTTPVCRECGERVVARVLGMRAPRFVGTVSGPHAITKALPAMAVSLGTSQDDAHGG